MEAQFFKANQQLLTGKRVLIGVSAGVDSMVLLALMEKLQTIGQIEIGVAHIDHNLRPESKQEAIFLTDYCRAKKIVLYKTHWDAKPLSGIEEKARAFRYRFFAQTMEEYKYDVLLTAHHADDQAETILMRVIRGGSLASYAGIKKQQPFANGQLIRPLLQFSKVEIYAYAKANQLMFYEDQSNQTLEFMRNRLRLQVLPVLKEENPKVLQHFEQFHQQITLADQALASLLAPRLAKVKKVNATWRFEATILPQLEAEQYYFLTFFFQQANVVVNQPQLEQIMGLVAKERSQWQVDLALNWQFRRSYEQYVLQKKPPQSNEPGTFSLGLNETLTVSESETFHLKHGSVTETKATYQLSLPLETALPLVIRRRQAGDKIALTPQLTKKLRRYLIDQKIPQVTRDLAWVVADANGQVLALVPLVNSYLSIKNETDKIHYILEYNAHNEY